MICKKIPIVVFAIHPFLSRVQRLDPVVKIIVCDEESVRPFSRKTRGHQGERQQQAYYEYKHTERCRQARTLSLAIYLGEPIS